MTDTTLKERDAAMVIAALPDDAVPRFLRHSIGDRTLSGMVRDLNDAVLSDDARRRAAAETALRRIGFL